MNSITNGFNHNLINHKLINHKLFNDDGDDTGNDDGGDGDGDGDGDGGVFSFSSAPRPFCSDHSQNPEEGCAHMLDLSPNTCHRMARNAGS